MESAEIQELCQTWADAERAGDAGTLARLAVEDFALVGPLGFLLDKQQWVNRFSGERPLVIDQLDWQPQSVRVYGDAAVVVGSYSQKGAYQGDPVDTEFRITLMLVRRKHGWRLAHIQVSSLGASLASPNREGAEQ
jgi:uncharacterized protein (TIGR02246 family)